MQHLFGSVPVEAAAGSPFREPVGRQQGGQGCWQAVEHALPGLSGVGFFLPLDPFPDIDHLLGSVCPGGGEHVRMAPDDLATDGGHHVVDVEPAGLGRQLALEDDLEQQVSQFLEGLLDEVGLEGVEGLLAVPGATVGGAQPAHDFHQLGQLRLFAVHALSTLPARKKGPPEIPAGGPRPMTPRGLEPLLPA